MKHCFFLTLLALANFADIHLLQADCYQLIYRPEANHIALVVDRSGSMAGQPLADAKRGVKAFLRQMRPTDRATLITFDDTVQLVQGETSNQTALSRTVDDIRPAGATALYDAIARAALTLIHKKGNRLIIYLTDGADNRSRYRLVELEKITVSEGILVYGIGLGRVDIQRLNQLSRQTSGTFEHTLQSADLENLYLRVLNQYYEQYGRQQTNVGTLIVTSIPDGQEVVIDGRKVGRTPHKSVGLNPGQYQIGIIYNRGIWECNTVVQKSYLTLIDSRESDLGADLLIVSSPQGSTVFLDDIYVGITAIGTPLSLKQGNWVARAQADGRQLRVRKVPYGNHRFRLRGIPDFNFGSDQEIEIEIPISRDEIVLYFDIFRQKVIDAKGQVYAVGRPTDPFSELEGDFDDFDDELEDF